MNTANDDQKKEKILLMHLPFWTPLIAPLGISSLKSYLAKYGYSVRTYDGNIVPELWDINRIYFDTLKTMIPEKNRGNFYNIGYNVLRNHLMLHLNAKTEDDYEEILALIIDRHYYCEVSKEQIKQLKEVIDLYYNRLSTCLLELIDDVKPEIIGISALSGTLASSVFAFKLIKKKYPYIRTLMGGGIFSDQMPLGSPDLEYFIENTPYIDKIMIGEGEQLLLKYLNGELDDNKKVYTLKNTKTGVLDISMKNIPDLSDFDLSYYPYIGATGSKSCPNQCSFCNVSVYWGNYRKKDATQIVEEMSELHKKYGSQLFFMTDALLNPIISGLSNELIKEGASFYWDGYLRVSDDVCNIDNTILWRRGGFYRARIGIESGSQHVLDIMNKNITVEQSKAAVIALASAGIKTTAYIVIGHPGETEDDFRRTLEFIEELKDYLWEVECNPFGYYYTGQNNSDAWATKRILLYPEKAREFLMTQSWDLDCEPSRKERYDRVFRFTEHCNRLGIPNPYSLQEVYSADERWKRLHKNAVPSLIEFKNKNKYINENLNISKILFAKNTLNLTEDFDF